MITEDYVSFETARLLKEKGFEGNVNAYYHIWDNGHRVCSVQEFTHSEAPYLYIQAPTLQIAMKWLREVHNIFVEISISIDFNGNYHFRYTILDKECKYIRRGYTNFDWEYEDACDAAIKYCLENLI